MKSPQQEISAGAVIFTGGKERKYLLLHYPEGHWDFPKGHIEAVESEKQAALREIKEETGITGISFIKGFKERIHYFYTRGKISFSKEATFFLAEADNTAINISFEHTGFEWLPYNGALARLTYKNAKCILKKAEEFLNSGQKNAI